MAKKKKGKASSSKRAYDNSARTARSSESQQAIISTLANLLAEKRGGDVQIQEIADRTGITKRTIFRFFKDKTTLLKALDNYLLGYLSAGARQLETYNFIDFSKNAIKLFEENEAVTMAYVLSPLGQEARLLFRKKLNQMMMEKILSERKIKRTSSTAGKIALVINLVNAKVWYDLKTEHSLSGKEIADALGWGLETLLKDLEK